MSGDLPFSTARFKLGVCLGITSLLLETFLPSSYPAGSGWARFQGLFAYLGNFTHPAIEVGRKLRTEMWGGVLVGDLMCCHCTTRPLVRTLLSTELHPLGMSAHPCVAGFGILTVHLVSRHILVSDLGGG